MSSFAEGRKVPDTEAALPRWTAINYTYMHT